MDHLIGGYHDAYEMTKAAERRIQRKEVTASETVVVTASAVVLESGWDSMRPSLLAAAKRPDDKLKALRVSALG